MFGLQSVSEVSSCSSYFKIQAKYAHCYIPTVHYIYANKRQKKSSICDFNIISAFLGSFLWSYEGKTGEN